MIITLSSGIRLMVFKGLSTRNTFNDFIVAKFFAASSLPLYKKIYKGTFI